MSDKEVRMKKKGHARLRRSVQNDIPDLEAIRKEVLKEGFAELADSRAYLEGGENMEKNKHKRSQSDVENERTVRSDQIFGGPPKGPKRWLAWGIGLAAVALALVLILPQLNLTGTLPATSTEQTKVALEAAGESGEAVGTDMNAPVETTERLPDEDQIEESLSPTDTPDEEGVYAQHQESGVTFLQSHLQRGGGSIRLTNLMDNPMMYGAGYYIQRYENGEWVDLEMIQPMNITLVGYELLVGETTYIYANWEFYYGELPNGRYRYVNDPIQAEFELTDETPPGPGYVVAPQDYRAELITRTDDSDVTLTLDTSSDDLADLTLSLENTGDQAYEYGSSYVVLRVLSEEMPPDIPEIERWGYVPMIPNTAFTALAYPLPAGETVDEPINMTYVYELTEPGEYELMTGFFPAEGDVDDHFMVGTTFTVTQAMIDSQPKQVDTPSADTEPEETDLSSETSATSPEEPTAQD